MTPNSGPASSPLLTPPCATKVRAMTLTKHPNVSSQTPSAPGSRPSSATGTPGTTGFAWSLEAVVALTADHRVLVSPELSLEALPESLPESLSESWSGPVALLEWHTILPIAHSTSDGANDKMASALAELHELLDYLRVRAPGLKVLLAHEQEYRRLKGSFWAIQMMVTADKPFRRLLRAAERRYNDSCHRPTFWRLRTGRFPSLGRNLTPRWIVSALRKATWGRRNFGTDLMEIATAPSTSIAHNRAHRILEPALLEREVFYEQSPKLWFSACESLGFEGIWNELTNPYLDSEARLHARSSIEFAPCLTLDPDEAKLRLELLDAGLSPREAATAALAVLARS